MYVISSGDMKVSQSLVEIQIQSGGNHIGSHSEELLWDEECQKNDDNSSN